MFILIGSIPMLFLLFAFVVEFLDIHSNSFTGSLPSELALLSDLEYLDVSSNPQLGGTLPEGVHLLFDLRHMNLSFTSIEIGAIPDDFCHWLYFLDKISVTCSGENANVTRCDCCVCLD
jgi:hypothetical protein